MSAYPSAVQVSAQVIDLAAFRQSEPPAPIPDALEASLIEAEPVPAIAVGGNVVSLFPEFRLRQTPIVRARRRDGQAPAAPDLVTACDLLVGNFRALQEAVLALQESCRELEADADLAEISTSGVLLGIAAVSTASETFQLELAATVDAAFR
jgi:hypothetical protein